MRDVYGRARGSRVSSASAPMPPARRRLSTSSSPITPSDPYGLPTSWVSQLFESSDRRFLVATPRAWSSFSVTPTNEAAFVSYDARQGLSDRNITALSEDLGGNLWLGTIAGAMKLARVGFSTYGKAGGIEASIAIFEDRSGRLCFRGSVLGDARDQCLRRGKAGPVDGRGGTPAFTARLFRRPAFRLVQADCGDGFGWVGRARDPSDACRRMVGRYGERALSLSACDDFRTLRTARPIALYTTKDGLAALQVYQAVRRPRGNVWVSTTSAEQRPALRAGNGRRAA